MQDDLRTDMQFANDPAVAVYMQSLVPCKQLGQTYSLRSTYELKKRLGLNLNFAHSAAHSGFRPDLNPVVDPANFPGVDPVTGGFFGAGAALALAAGQISLVNVPQAIIGSAVDYHFPSGFDGELRFNYGSYTDAVRPDLTGKLRSYTAFFGRTW